MQFSYDEYMGFTKYFVEEFHAYESLNTIRLKQLMDEYEKKELKVEDVLGRMESRVSSEYYSKVEFAQRMAMEYAEKVFPTYKFILPDALIDDWLSTVDMHRDRPTRDHSLHQPLSSYIVAKMLGFGDPNAGFKIGNGQTLLGKCAKMLYDEPKLEYLRNYVRTIDPDFDKKRNLYDLDWAGKVVYEATVVAALFHDMGYPWQYVNRLSNSIAHANYDDVSKLLIEPNGVMSTIKGRLLEYPLYGYDDVAVNNPGENQKDQAIALIEKGLMKTHGMPGALGFMCLNDSIREYGKTDPYYDASFRLILDWAAVGIMMHDMKGLYWGKSDQPETPILRIDFEKDPLSCLVALADILEEFHRPSAEFDLNNKGEKDEYVSVKYGFTCKGSEIDMDGDLLKVTYHYGSQEAADNCLKDREKEVEEYLKPPYGYLDLSSWGITDVKGYTEV